MEKTIPDLNEEFWRNRYLNDQTGWDIGYPSPALIDYAHHWGKKDKKILIPGAGRSYETEKLYRDGFEHVFALDITENAKQEFLKRVDNFPEEQYMVGDFFALDARYDLILEQTFFCALDPVLRQAYVEKMSHLLEPNGILAGVLFEMEKPDGPPFGGHRNEYTALFEKHFEILTMEPCYNSIPPRAGNELFVEFRKF